MNFPGTAVAQVFSPDAGHCQQVCTQHHSCSFFTFMGPSFTDVSKRFHCYLRDSSSGQPGPKTPLQGVTSGCSLKTCQPAQSDLCLAKVYQNLDFVGPEYRTFFTADADECQRACNVDPGCKFFTFNGPLFVEANHRFKCFLKHSWTTVPRTPIVTATDGVVSGFSLKMAPTLNEATDPGCKTMIFPLRTHFQGSDFENMPAASPEHCLYLCSAHPHCTHFSYTTTEWKTTDKSRLLRCYLKHNIRELKDVPTEGVISGIPTRHCQPNYDWVKKLYEGIDFTASDMRFFTTTDTAPCQKACTDDPRCQFFAYVKDSFRVPEFRRRCYLKRVVAVPVPAKVVSVDNVVSGFSLKNC